MMCNYIVIPFYRAMHLVCIVSCDLLSTSVLHNYTNKKKE